MQRLISQIHPEDPLYIQQREGMLELVAQLRALEQRASEASARSKPLFDARGALLPRERLRQLLDFDAPYLPLSTLSGYGMGDEPLETTIPGGSLLCGIGVVRGVRCAVLVNDSGIGAGALTESGNQKFLRLQTIALENKLPFVQLIESAGANLLQYKVEKFVEGGAIFYNLARLSAAGLPVIAVVHGSSTAGGAYMPGLSDYVIMVRGQAKAFLAGAPLLKAATGEIATDEELGGAAMHASISGLAEYVAEDDGSAIRLAREVIAALAWNAPLTGTTSRALGTRAPGTGWTPQLQTPAGPASQGSDDPCYSPDELAGVMPLSHKTPIDMREVIARIVDNSEALDFKPDFGAATLCLHARIAGIAVGILSNNGPIDPNGANKAAQFIQLCNQSNTALIYLQNTTGFIVGKSSEEGGMIKHGSKMIQALSNSHVPQITIHCGASFGAGNYGMCGRAFGPRFVFSWPNAKTAVMGAEQAATTMDIVARAGARRKGITVDETRLAAQRSAIVERFERQMGAFYTSGQMLDDGVIDPRDTRAVLALVLTIVHEAAARTLHPVEFGVARF